VTLRIADHWFERRRIDDEITLLLEPHVDPFLRCNIWHVRVSPALRWGESEPPNLATEINADGGAY
jgi:hypothetical protein